MTGLDPPVVAGGLPDPQAGPLPAAEALPGAVGTVRRAVPYATRPGFRPLLLELYQPASNRGGPAVLFLHGGGWRVGDRTVFCPTWRDWRPGPFSRLVAAGTTVASADYRLSGEAHFPAQLADVIGALDWLEARAAQIGIEPRRLVVWGESAGGHLAALAALAPETAGRIAGVVDWYGPADLLTGPGAADPGSREGLLLGAAPLAATELARAASPVAQVRAAVGDTAGDRVASAVPPFHIAHGIADRLVPVAQSEALAAALRAAGVPVELDLLPGAGHLWQGAADPETIFVRALDFTRRVTS